MLVGNHQSHRAAGGWSARLLGVTSAIALAAAIGAVTPQPASAFTCVSASNPAAGNSGATDNGEISNTACGDAATAGPEAVKAIITVRHSALRPRRAARMLPQSALSPMQRHSTPPPWAFLQTPTLRAPPRSAEAAGRAWRRTRPVNSASPLVAATPLAKVQTQARIMPLRLVGVRMRLV